MSDLARLKSAFIDIAWMARRYADGRQTYAPGMCNAALDVAKSLGISIEPDATLTDPNYARDGSRLWDSGEQRFEKPPASETGSPPS